MSESSTLRTYSLEDFMSLKNNFREINDDVKYSDLNKFIKKYEVLIKNNKIKYTGINTNVPLHLLQKYGNVKVPKVGEKSISIKIKEIFSKMSVSNYEEMIVKLSELNIQNDKFDDEIPTLIFETMIDLIYLIDVYIYVIKYLKENLSEIYNKVIHKCVHYNDKYLKMNDINKVKRWRINNVKLLSQLFLNGYVTNNQLTKIIDHYLHCCRPDDDIYVYLVTEIIGIIMNPPNIPSIQFNKLPDDYLDAVFDKLSLISISKEYSSHVRIKINNAINF